MSDQKKRDAAVEEIEEKMIDGGMMDPSEKKFKESTNEPPADPDDADEITLPHAYELQAPFTDKDGREIKEIVFRKPLTGSMTKHLPMDPALMQEGHWHPVLSEMTGETRQTIGQVRRMDIMQMIQVALFFSG